jgi:hypothetical protein
MSDTPEPPEALATIYAAADGLLMPSESDYPFTPFHWLEPGPLTAAALIEHLGLPPDTPVEVGDALALLDQLAAEQDWFGDHERAMAARFAALRDTLANSLTSLMLYRLGRIQITLVIAGRDVNGAIVGLQTTVIET